LLKYTKQRVMLSEKVIISVLMATYNTDFNLIKRAINSVLNQDFPNFELIVIDDGSTNDTYNLLYNFIKKFEDKIIYVRHANTGQSHSINRGILNSIGEYITILDADDEYKPNHLSNCLLAMQSADLIASNTETIVESVDDYYVPDKDDHKKNIHVDDCILFATLFGKKEVFIKLKFNKIYSADSDFYERAARQFVVNKLDLRSYIYYRNNPNSLCANMKNEIAMVSVN